MQHKEKKRKGGLKEIVRSLPGESRAHVKRTRGPPGVFGKNRGRSTNPKTVRGSGSKTSRNLEAAVRDTKTALDPGKGLKKKRYREGGRKQKCFPPAWGRKGEKGGV